MDGFTATSKPMVLPLKCSNSYLVIPIETRFRVLLFLFIVNYIFKTPSLRAGHEINRYLLWRKIIKIFTSIIIVSLLSWPVSAQLNVELKRHFLEDQEARSEANRKRNIFPKFKDEIGRRIFVFKAIANGQVTTADDYFHASVILQHTNHEFVGDKLKSMGNENHLLAHFLAKKAYELGHEEGAWLMAATYNRYLDNADIDVNKYGLRHKDNRLFANDETITNDDRIEKGLIPISINSTERQ